MKILYVDFCGTLTTTSTLYKFGRYVLKKHSLYTKIYFALFFFFSRWLNLLNMNLFKPFSKITLEKLDFYAKDFFQSCIKPELNYKTINLINEYVNRGYFIVIISGGLKNYIKYIKRFVKIDKIIAKEFLQKNDLIKTEFKNGTVFQIDKVFQIYEFEKRQNKAVKERVVISDSEDDIPLFLLADKKIVINPSSNKLVRLAHDWNWEVI